MQQLVGKMGGYGGYCGGEMISVCLQFFWNPMLSITACSVQNSQHFIAVRNQLC